MQQAALATRISCPCFFSTIFQRPLQHYLEMKHVQDCSPPLPQTKDARAGVIGEPIKSFDIREFIESHALDLEVQLPSPDLEISTQTTKTT
jgi:hypothetical protein